MTTDNTKLTHTFRQIFVNIVLPVNFQYMVQKFWIEWYIKYCISEIFDFLCVGAFLDVIYDTFPNLFHNLLIFSRFGRFLA